MATLTEVEHFGFLAALGMTGGRLLGDSAALRSVGMGGHRSRSYGRQVGASSPADEEGLSAEGAAAVCDVEAGDHADSEDYHGGDAYEEA